METLEMIITANRLEQIDKLRTGFNRTAWVEHAIDLQIAREMREGTTSALRSKQTGKKRKFPPDNGYDGFGVDL